MFYSSQLRMKLTVIKIWPQTFDAPVSHRENEVRSLHTDQYRENVKSVVGQKTINQSHTVL